MSSASVIQCGSPLGPSCSRAVILVPSKQHSRTKDTQYKYCLLIHTNLLLCTGSVIFLNFVQYNQINISPSCFWLLRVCPKKLQLLCIFKSLEGFVFEGMKKISVVGQLNFFNMNYNFSINQKLKTSFISYSFRYAHAK